MDLQGEDPSDDSIERYKARLVARGFKQEYGRNYKETFAPVAHMQIVCTLVAVVAVQIGRASCRERVCLYV